MEESIYQKAKIVVVDDVEEVLNSTKSCLEFEGMQVQCFSNPLEGLEYLKQNEADVLLVDFFMPQMNGDEFVEKLREFNQKIIVILLTGYSDKIPPLEMIDRMNIQGYLDKLKGENELVLMTKAAIKTAFLNKQIIEKDREISRMHIKKSITGNLIPSLVNDAKGQLMLISAMNEFIKSKTEDFEKETEGIENAIAKIAKLYQALNFEYEKEIKLHDLVEILQVLLKANLLISNSTLNFDISENFMIENGNEIMYFIIGAVQLLSKNQKNDITIKMQKEGKDIRIFIHAQNVDGIDLNALTLLAGEQSIERKDDTISALLPI